MTEINIERKQKRAMWPWLLGVALLVLLFVLMRNRGSDDTAAADTRTDSAAVNTSTGDVSRDTASAVRRP